MIVLIIYNLLLLWVEFYQELGASTAEEAATTTDKQAQKTAQGSDLCM